MKTRGPQPALLERGEEGGKCNGSKFLLAKCTTIKSYQGSPPRGNGWWGKRRQDRQWSAILLTRQNGTKWTIMTSMNQIDYTFLVRRWCLGSLLVSFLSLLYMVLSLDPYTNSSYTWAFLIALLVFLTSGIALFSIWYFFKNQKKILSVSQTNNMLYQSLISSGALIFILVLQQTGYLNVITMLTVLLCYCLYQIWANSQAQK